jgi:hypothetical protein
MIRIDKRLPSALRTFRSTEEILMRKAAIASTRSRMPQGLAFSTFGVKLKTFGATSTPLPMEKTTNHNTTAIPATIAGKLIMQAFFRNV